MRETELEEFEQDVARVATSLTTRRDSRGRYEQILLAYDGSADARAALERVAAVASDDSQVTVLTVIPYEAISSKLDPIHQDDRDWQWQCLVEATAYLREQGIAPFIEAAAGNPGSVIGETARSLDADLVILGNGNGGHWRPSIRKSPVRPSVEKHVKCDTLVVRAELRSPAPHAAEASDERRVPRLPNALGRLRVSRPGVSHVVAR